MAIRVETDFLSQLKPGSNMNRRPKGDVLGERSVIVKQLRGQGYTAKDDDAILRSAGKAAKRLGFALRKFTPDEDDGELQAGTTYIFRVALKDEAPVEVNAE